MTGRRSLPVDRDRALTAPSCGPLTTPAPFQTARVTPVLNLRPRCARGLRPTAPSGVEGAWSKDPRSSRSWSTGVTASGNRAYRSATARAAASCFRWDSRRHVSGDWGDLCEEDCAENERALCVGWTPYSLAISLVVFCLLMASRATLALPLCTVSFAVCCHLCLLVDTLLDTAILSYRPVQLLGTSIERVAQDWLNSCPVLDWFREVVSVWLCHEGLPADGSA